MTDFPDILGMELHDAKALLEAEGLDFIMIETKPEKRGIAEGVLRIIRVQPQDDHLVLTVCRI